MTQLRDGRYRTAIIGVGRQGTYFARAAALNPAMEIVAGCNRGKETLDLFSERFKVPGYLDYRELLRKEKVDIAVLVLPVKPNPEIVIACARAGVPGIVTEKPIVSTLTDLDSMVEACAMSGSKYQSGNVDRNYAEQWKARELIAAGQIGEVRSVHSYANIVQGGCNALAWMKMFALGQFIRGKSGADADAEWVVGHVNGDPFSDHDEGLEGIGGYIRFTNGIEGHVYNKPSAKHGVEVIGTEGVFASDGRKLRFWKKSKDAGPNVFSGLVEVPGLVPDIPDEFDNKRDEEGWLIPDPRIKATLQSIVDSLDKGIEPRCSGVDQQKAFEISVALRESHRRNHAPVKLPLPPEVRSQPMMPVPYRWNSKRDLYGDQWYRDEMKKYKK